MLDESDASESNNNISQSTPFLNKFVEQENEVKHDSLQLNETEGAAMQNADDDKIDINDIVREKVVWKSFCAAMYMDLSFLTFSRDFCPQIYNKTFFSRSSQA